MIQKGQKEIIQLLATEHNLPLNGVEKIVYSQFKLAARTMSAGNFESTRLPLLGVFRVLPARVEKLNERTRIKNAKRESTNT